MSLVLINIIMCSDYIISLDLLQSHPFIFKLTFNSSDVQKKRKELVYSKLSEMLQSFHMNYRNTCAEGLNPNKRKKYTLAWDVTNIDVRESDCHNTDREKLYTAPKQWLVLPSRLYLFFSLMVLILDLYVFCVSLMSYKAAKQMNMSETSEGGAPVRKTSQQSFTYLSKMVLPF